MPARFSDIARVGSNHYGLSFEKPRSGSHWKARDSSGKCFPITAHNGMRSEIPDFYIKALCRCFSISKDEFCARLRGEDV